jgi:hypothetical protein
MRWRVVIVVAAAALAACRFDPSGVSASTGADGPPPWDGTGDLAADELAGDLVAPDSVPDASADGPALPDGPTPDSAVDAPAPDQTPCLQWAFEFSGNEWLDVEGTDSAFNLQNNFGVAAWVKPSELHPNKEYHVVSRHAHGACTGYVLMIKNQVPEFRVYHGFGGMMPPSCQSCWCNDTGTTVSKTNIWHHLAGSFTQGTARLFLDGKLIKTCSCPGATVASSFIKLRVGVSAENSTQFHFNGIIDDVLLTDAVWMADFAPKSLPLPPDCANVVGRYPFAEGTGQTTAPDCPGAPLLRRGGTTVTTLNDPTWVQTECLADR